VSGRRPAPRTPEEERELTRAIIRELHEEVQAAKEVRRGMREDYDQAVAACEKLMKDVTTLHSKGMEQLQEFFATGIQKTTDLLHTLDADVERLAGMVVEAEHVVAGLPDQDTTMRMCLQRIADVARMKLSEPKFMEDLGTLVAQKLQRPLDQVLDALEGSKS